MRFVYNNFRAYIHLKFKHPVIRTRLSCLSRAISFCSLFCCSFLRGYVFLVCVCCWWCFGGFFVLFFFGEDMIFCVFFSEKVEGVV